MAAPKASLDRFGTLRGILDMVADIKALEVDGVPGGYAAALAAVVFWDSADGRSGVAIMTATRLAERLGSNRRVAARAIRTLESLQLIRKATRANGAIISGRWLVRHIRKGG
jgi:hypothetical protein